MRFRSLEDLVAAGALRRVRPDRRLIARLETRAKRDLDLARDVVLERDPERAATIAYEAGLRACLGVLQYAGYRVTADAGHHLAALEGAAAVLGDGFRSTLRELDDARELRNQSLYGEPLPVTNASVRATFDSAERVLTALKSRKRSTNA